MSDLSGDFKKLFENLDRVKAKFGVAALRTSLRKSVRPVIQQMRARAPQGKVAHRTYKKRLVAPGFLRRNIALITKVDRAAGKVSAIMGVRPEAYYGIQFFDQGTYTITKRRMGKGRGTINVKPYTLKIRPWFETVFRANRSNMETSFAGFVRVEMEKAVKKGAP